MSTIQLRDYQIEAIQAVADRLRAGTRRSLIALPTGTGKTLVFATIIDGATRKDNRCLVLAHRDELLSQAKDKLMQVAPHLEPHIGFVQGSNDAYTKSVVIASVQTLARRRRILRLLDAHATSLDPAYPKRIIPLADAEDAAAERLRDARRAYGAERVALRDALTVSADAGRTIDPEIEGELLTAVEEAKAGRDAAQRGYDEAKAERDEEIVRTLDGRWPFQIIIVDEAHHTSADTYGEVLRMLGCYADGGPLLVGVTATPQRADGRDLGDTYQEIVYHRDMLTMMRAGYLAPLRGLRIKLAGFNTSKLRVQAGDFVDSDSEEALRDAEAPKHVVEAYQRRGDGRKTIVFTPTIALAHEMADEFREAGVSAEAVSGVGMDERRAILRRFHTGQTTVVTNAMVLTEGFDEPSVECIIIARPTKSQPLYCFDSETEVLTRSGWLPGRETTDGQEVAAFATESGEVRWETASNVFERDMLPDERMMELDSPQAGFRVTADHRIVHRVKTGRARILSDWKVATARQVSELRTAWLLPVSGVESALGIPLTDAEIAFVAWVQTDGSFNPLNGQIQISQQYPDQCAHIEATLTACRFKWRVSERTGSTAYGPRRHVLKVYRVSRGAARGEDRHLRGWGALSEWIPKSDLDAWQRLEGMDVRQWRIFLDAWHRGDGSKQLGQTWTRRGYHLAVASHGTAGWIQSMCMRRGWRANIVKQAAIWMVHCKEADTRYVGGACQVDRPRLVESAAIRGERVWCLSVPSGAILTRRRGKGAILGQCQMVGRGTRISRETGKRDALIIDVVGVTDRMDLTTLPKLFGLGEPETVSEGDDEMVLEEATETIIEQQERMIEEGRIVAKQVELFQRNDFAWQQIRPGEWVLNAADVTVAVTARPDGLWDVAAYQRGGQAERVATGLAQGYAMGAAEDYARRMPSFQPKLVDKNAEWRGRPASEGQIDTLTRWRVAILRDEQGRVAMTRGEAADVMSAKIARWRMRGAERR